MKIKNKHAIIAIILIALLVYGFQNKMQRKNGKYPWAKYEVIAPEVIVPDSLGGKKLMGYAIIEFKMDKDRNILSHKIFNIYAGTDIDSMVVYNNGRDSIGRALYQKMSPWLESCFSKLKIIDKKDTIMYWNDYDTDVGQYNVEFNEDVSFKPESYIKWIRPKILLPKSMNIYRSNVAARAKVLLVKDKGILKYRIFSLSAFLKNEDSEPFVNYSNLYLNSHQDSSGMALYNKMSLWFKKYFSRLKYKILDQEKLWSKGDTVAVYHVLFPENEVMAY